MRWDMFKVIVERPRFDNGRPPKGKNRKWQRIPMEEWPSREFRGMKLRSKYLNENLAPLHRFIERQLGRPWDKVFQEICERLRVDSAVQKHVRDHLPDIVALDVEKHGRMVHHKPGSYRFASGEISQAFYVDPRTGILRRYRDGTGKRWKFSQDPKRSTFVTLSVNVQLHCSVGIWYEITLEDADQGSMDERDVWLKKRVGMATRGELERTYGRLAYASGKRQLNKKEIRNFREKYRDEFAAIEEQCGKEEQQ